jgi:hypothetical protein
MILWFSSEILEDGLLPVPFHVIPVVYQALPDGVVYAIAWSLCICNRLVADEEIEIFHLAFGRCKTGGDTSAASSWRGCRSSRCNCSRKYTNNKKVSGSVLKLQWVSTNKDGSEFPAKLRNQIRNVNGAYREIDLATNPTFENPVPLSQMIGASNDIGDSWLLEYQESDHPNVLFVTACHQPRILTIQYNAHHDVHLVCM